MSNVTIKASTIKELCGIGRVPILAYLALASMTDSQGFVDISTGKLAELVGVSRTTAWRAVQDLERAGLILAKWMKGKELARLLLIVNHTPTI